MAKKILIVDDEEMIRNLFFRLGRRLGYEVYQAENGVRGLEAALRERPDLVITDVDMPEMNGIELTRRLKRDETTRDIKVIVSTGRRGYEREINEAGADGYLPKPYEFSQLTQRIREYLGE